MMMSCTMQSHIKAMKMIIKYMVTTAYRGLLLKPNAVWNEGREFLFRVTGMSDSDYAKDDSKKGASGWSTFLNGAETSFRSKLFPIIAISVTESELFSAVMCAQDMPFVVRISISMVLKVSLPIKIEIDNKGKKDIIHNWSVGIRLRHVEVKHFFLR